ncbi:MAG: alanine/ornithine racemase family PLP-dependent enzyme [Firmicutes bacterium]|nr:alanine/ornithine racemase family PLP-dependent enzyme [Bacillota bacterium]
MAYPSLTVNLPRLRKNVRTVRRLCEERGIGITAVTKVFEADPVIAKVLVEEGMTILGDSRVDNLERLAKLNAEKWLIRPPMISEAARLVRFGEASLNSEIEVIRAIEKECEKQGRKHKIILMADLGDIREGYVDADELIEAAKEVAAMPHVELYGLGVNLTCFSFVQYDTEKLTQLAELGKRVEEAAGVKLQVISGGNSATVDLMLRGGIPEGVNNLRLGESVLFGKERAKYTYLPDTYRDVFTLHAEIVELKEKPSLPWGDIGVDSYGRKPEFTDRGPKRLKAICALGKQDFDPEISTPCDPGVILLGASSDHLMLDVTDAEKTYRVGDCIDLELGYFSTTRAFTSSYVRKEYIFEE